MAKSWEDYAAEKVREHAFPLKGAHGATLGDAQKRPAERAFFAGTSGSYLAQTT